MKVSELEGAALDYWVAKALGYAHHGAVGTDGPNQAGKPWCRSEVNDWWKDPTGTWLCGPCHGFPCAYSTDWAQGGPIIERERMQIACDYTKPPIVWTADMEYANGGSIEPQDGPTLLVAAMRMFVASHYGEEMPTSGLPETEAKK